MALNSQFTGTDSKPGYLPLRQLKRLSRFMFFLNEVGLNPVGRTYPVFKLSPWESLGCHETFSPPP